MMVLIWNLLKSRQHDEEWNPACSGGRRSAFAHRQYPQVRVFAAGWSDHDRCLCCLNNLLVADVLRCGCSVAPTAEDHSLKTKQVEATAEQISRARKGNLGHRI